jgi:hypothetical protein
MSKIALSPNVGGSGVFTIASPNSNSDRTLSLPDAGGTVFVSGQALSATTGSFSGDVTLGSSVLATPTGSAPSYTCRAWVNFNGTGTVAIRASGNVSSITDNGTGDYTVNFTTAMPDANYSANCSTVYGTTSRESVTFFTGTPSTTAIRVLTGYTYIAPGASDNSYLYVTIFR